MEEILELQEDYDIIMHAVCSEDVFGSFSGQSAKEQLVELECSFKNLSDKVDPGNYSDSLDVGEMAAEAFERLKKFYETARAKIQSGIYGRRLAESKDSFLIQTTTRGYYVEKHLADGEIATIFSGQCAGGEDAAGRIAVKIVDDPADNDLMDNEFNVLKIFRQNPGNQSKHLPILLDQCQSNDGRRIHILRQLDGHSFEQIRQHPLYKNGVPQKHMVWMLNRALSALGFVHTLGIINCNLDPTHLVLRPKDHNLWVVGWGAASIRQAPFRIFNEDFSPPEVKARKKPIPATDLYSLGKCMIYILGGNIKTNDMSDSVEPKIQQFLKWLVNESPIQRPQDAWQLHGMLEKLVIDLWGPKKFLKFEW